MKIKPLILLLFLLLLSVAKAEVTPIKLPKPAIITKTECDQTKCRIYFSDGTWKDVPKH